jgi:hypothetical protein
VQRDIQHATAGGGASLPHGALSRMGAAFSADFSAVRVHTGSAADDAASKLNAHALTAGTDILFHSGAYKPGTHYGDRLLAHELAHVVQQRDGVARAPIDAGPSDPLERAADASADNVMKGFQHHGPAGNAGVSDLAVAKGQSSGQEPSIAMKSASGVKIGVPDDGFKIQADQSAEAYIRGGASARKEEHQKLPAPQNPAPIQRAPKPAPRSPQPAADPASKPAPQSSQPAADPAVVLNAVDAVCRGIDDDSVDAVVAPLRGLSISAAAAVRSGVLMRRTVLLERWLLKPHGDRTTIEDIASIALMTVPSVALPSVAFRTKITAAAEEGLRLLWPALPLIDRLEVYDEGFREIEQAQLDVIRQASLKERAEAQEQADPRLFAFYSKMSAEEEFEARNLMDSSDKDVVYDALMALDRIDRKFVFDQHYTELKDLLYRDEFNLVAALTHGSEAQMIIARLRLATEDRKDDMEAVRAMVERAVALLTERQQLREAHSARLLTAEDRARIDERLQELDDLDVLLQFKRTAKGDLKENTFMALLAGAEDQQAAFGSHMDRLAPFASDRRAFALEAAKQRVLIAGSNQDELRSILLTTHAPVEPKDKTKRTDLKQWEEDIQLRKELLSDPQVHKVFVGLLGSEQMNVLAALEGDAFDDRLQRLNQMKNAGLWGEFFDLIGTIARNEEWRTRFEKTKTEYWSLYAFVSGEEREIMETILFDSEHKIPIIKLLRYTGKVSTLKAAFANIQENEREQLRTGWALANHPFIGPRTEPQDSALAAFQEFDEELKKSQGSDREGYETVLATVLGTAPTKSEIATGQGRYNAAAILAQRVEKRLGLARGIAADFTETDETMDAAGRQFFALWLRLKDQPELSIVEYATLSTLYQQFEHRAEEFSEAAKAITDMAGTIAATLAGIVVVIATGGAATPAVVAMAAGAGAAGGFIAREAFGGDYYTAMSSEGGRALLLDSINGALAVLSGSLAARGVELMGLSGEALAQGVARVGEGAVQEAAQSLGRKALVSGVEAALDGLISGTISEAAGTFTDDRTWREGIMEGLARVGKSALLGGLFGLTGGAVLGSAMPVVGRVVGGLRKALAAGSLEKSLIRAGMGDILKTAQAAARSGDAHAVEMLISQMESKLAAEDAALLRQQLREELMQALPTADRTLGAAVESTLAEAGATQMLEAARSAMRAGETAEAQRLFSQLERNLTPAEANFLWRDLSHITEAATRLEQPITLLGERHTLKLVQSEGGTFFVLCSWCTRVRDVLKDALEKAEQEGLAAARISRLEELIGQVETMEANLISGKVAKGEATSTNTMRALLRRLTEGEHLIGSTLQELPAHSTASFTRLARDPAVASRAAELYEGYLEQLWSSRRAVFGRGKAMNRQLWEELEKEAKARALTQAQRESARGAPLELAPGAPARATVDPAADIPFGFYDRAGLEQFSKRLNATLGTAPDAHLIVEGSAVTGRRYERMIGPFGPTGSPFGLGRLSDYDIAIVSDSLFAKAKQFGIPMSGAQKLATDPLKPAELAKLGLAELDAAARESILDATGIAYPVHFSIRPANAPTKLGLPLAR